MSARATDRPPLRAAVIGAGMSGILATVKLRERGIECTVFEKADSVGGTWRDNSYPGLACDVPAHWYTYSFARNPDWTRLLAEGHELRAYFERVARDHDVVAHTRFGEEVTRLDYRDGGWDLATATGYRGRFDLVIVATGVLHHPNIPDFEGMDSFAGAAFHSARWDHSVAVDGKRVGVIGTGSTAAQITAALVSRVAHLDLFQRTPQWVLPRKNIAFSDEERAAFRDPAVLEALVAKMRETTFRGYATAVIDVDSPELAEIERLCRENLATVRDPELRASLTPDYRPACKRLVISEDFYEAIQHPAAELVTSPIVRVEPAGIRTADGVLHELDVLVLATGFHVDRFIRPAKVIGRDGMDLDAAWADSPTAYLSVAVPDFPNLFFLGGPNSPIGNFSLIEIAEQQIGYCLQLIDGLQRGEYREVEATSEALRRFEEERRAAARRTVWMTGCKSWYLDKDGVPQSWTFSYERFAQEMAAPRMADFETR
jgi:cation diffusion facilitator CzcD-associated flavoprotein CzcO